MNARDFSKTALPFSRFLMGTALAAGLAASANATTVLIDFGGTATPTTGGQSWNNVTAAMGAALGVAIPNLTATTGTGSGISLSIESRFNGANADGTQSASAPYPSTATGDSLFGNTAAFGGLSNIAPSFKLSGLVVGQTYDFTFFASRTGVSDNRNTLYTVSGATAGSVSLNASNNVSNRVTYSVTPDANGEVFINIGPGTGNNNANNFTYLNVLEINTVPEPGSLALAGLGSLLLLRRKRD